MTAQKWYEWLLGNAKDYSTGRIPYGTFSERSRHLHDSATKDGVMAEVLRLLTDAPVDIGWPLRGAEMLAKHDRRARKSRSFSMPESCVVLDGCRIEGAQVVWPDGERYPRGPMAEDGIAT